jgi:hypothetical protein
MGVLRPHAPSITGCQIVSHKYFLHLFDHLSVQAGALPLTADEIGTLRQDTFLSLTTGLPLPEESRPYLALCHRTHRWAYTRAEALLTRSVAYASLVLDDRFLVYPEDWHPDIRAAFGLEDPPTPQEVFSLFHTKYVPYHREMKKVMSLHEACLLDYYCLGGQVDALALCYKVTPANIVWLLAQTIKMLMQHTFFALWASGSDLNPLITNTATRLYCTSAMGMGKGVRQSGLINSKPDRSARYYADIENMRQTSPYYAMIITEGVRLNPIPRAYTAARWAWKAAEDRNHREANGWGIYYDMRIRVRHHWMIYKLLGKESLPSTVKIIYPAPFKNPSPRADNHIVFCKELASLYGQEELNEKRVAAIRTKWEDAFYARTGRYPGFREHRRSSGSVTK